MTNVWAVFPTNLFKIPLCPQSCPHQDTWRWPAAPGGVPLIPLFLVREQPACVSNPPGLSRVEAQLCVCSVYVIVDALYTSTSINMPRTEACYTLFSGTYTFRYLHSGAMDKAFVLQIIVIINTSYSVCQLT